MHKLPGFSFCHEPNSLKLTLKNFFMNRIKHRVLDWAGKALLALLPLTAGAQTYFTPMAMDGVELMGTVKFGVLDYEHLIFMDTGFYEFKYENKFQPQKDSPLHRCSVAGGSVYHEGKLYVNEYDDSGRLHEQKPHWRVYDANTFELLSDTELPDNCAATTTTLAYDRTTNKIYGFLATYTEMFFVEVNPENGEIKKIGEKLPYDYKYTCIACNKYGQLYCIYFRRNDGTHYLAKIRKSDGRMANIGILSADSYLPGDGFVDGGYSQSLFFNNATDQMYWAYSSASMNLPYEEYTPIMKVDVATARASMTSYLIDELFLTGMYFKEPAFTAPASVTGVEYSATTSDRLTGTINFDVPTTDYVGEALSGEVTVEITDGDKTLVEERVQPGTAYRSTPLTFTNGTQTVYITLTNAQGEVGPTVEKSFYAGYDIPKECKNIKLTAEGLTTTLTWDPPTEGMNGAPINPSDYTYTVIRYPNEVTVATGQKECRFSEEHPEEMTRYVYTVKAIDSAGREGKSAFSNNYIVGKPLDTPYGGYFTSAADFFNYYTIVDANGDARTWSFDTNTVSAFYLYNSLLDADDWIVSPPINYKKGKEYTVKFNAYSSNPGYLEALQVWCGKGRTPDTQTKLLLNLPEVPAVSEETPVQEYSVKFTVDKDSIYHFSFHVVSPAFSDRLYISNIRVAEEGASGIDQPGVEADAAVEVKAGKGSLSISNPQGLPVAIYHSNGSLLGQSSARNMEKPLAPGVYLVKHPGGVSKVVVR